MAWKVAPSYQYATIQKIDEAAHKAYVVATCDRCGGSGQYIIPPSFCGTCFKCNGVGKIAKWVKAYTDEEYDKYMRAQDATREKKAKARQARIEDLQNNSEANKAALLEKFGFDPENPQVWLVGGGDTFAIKDELKTAGARFKPALGWYFNKETAVPEGYKLVAVAFDDLFDWNPIVKSIDLKDNAKEVADKAIATLNPPSDSEYMGEIKERLRGLKATLENYRPIESYYGTSIIYTFKVDKNVVVWITSGKGLDSDIQIGDTVTITGTVKDHKEFRGVKQTILSRCLVKND